MPMHLQKRRKLQLSNLDAQGNATFAKQLEFVRKQNVEIRFPNFMARKLIPVKNDVDPGVNTITWRSYGPTGVAKIISNYADDLPRADVTGEQNSSQVYSIGNAYGFSIDEVAASAYQGTSLDTKKAAAARRANELKVEDLASIGDARYNIIGLLNQPNAGAYVPPAGSLSGATTAWSTKTPGEVLADLFGIRQTIINSTNGVEKPNTIVVPEAQFGLIATTPRSINSDTTLLDFFLKTSPGVEVLAWERLKGAGASSTDRMVAYYRDPDYLEMNIPKEWTELDPQERNLAIEIPCHSRFGGVILFYPLSMAYADGI